MHCQKGVSRSATAMLFYLMRVQGKTLSNALTLCQSRRSVVDPTVFMEQLKEYEQQCKDNGYIQNDDNSDDVDAKESTKSSTEKKRKASKDVESRKKIAIGPSRPPSTCIGPSRPPAAVTIVSNDRAESSGGSGPRLKNDITKVKKATIGPSRPPATINNDTNDNSNEESKGPIGPIRPQSNN